MPIEVPPYHLSGVVYATLLNHRSAWQSLGDAVNQPPTTMGRPRPRSCYVKPRNTLAASGDPVSVPAGVLGTGAGSKLGTRHRATRLPPRGSERAWNISQAM